MSSPVTFEDLVVLMDRLRDPGGCPWDREQTYETMRGYLLEECYEVVEAIDGGDADGLREELGDLLFQIVFLARLASEQGRFRASDVVGAIAEKMVRRHPHVFGSDRADTSGEVLRRWEEIKRRERDEGEERAPGSSVLDGIPRALPALLKAQRLSTKAARVGFDWPSDEGVIEKAEEELAELRQAVRAGAREAIGEELGDLLFALASLGRRLQVDPEAALERANLKFRGRFERRERALAREGIAVERAGLERLDRAWNAIKEDERGSP